MRQLAAAFKRIIEKRAYWAVFKSGSKLPHSEGALWALCCGKNYAALGVLAGIRDAEAAGTAALPGAVFPEDINRWTASEARTRKRNLHSSTSFSERNFFAFYKKGHG